MHDMSKVKCDHHRTHQAPVLRMLSHRCKTHSAMVSPWSTVVLSGQVETSTIGTGAFQETEIVGISRSCTKWNVMVKDVAELPRGINEAFRIATSGRPGPVLLDLPKHFLSL